ncbi:histo-blood group ABO system transferase-like [Trichomycterus rosablanca]|uniref:histo-blood group ABO system transferase-like n=1 Tax=Trichomycterus rosablanca TaxID=2290929 RepID=UPI002F35559E
MEEEDEDAVQDEETRPDVVTTTPWLAPIVWDGTFDQTVMDAIYKQQNITVATTVFALGKYVDFLKDFLETAEKNFFLHYNVHYYVFTDRPDDVPAVTLSPGHKLTVLKTASSNRWQEITLRRMEMIEKLIEEHLINKAEYIFSLDVDCKFYGPWGAESLGDIVATLHPGYYGQSRNKFPYERRPESQAYIRQEEGDYYYGGAVIGGRVDRVLKLIPRNLRASSLARLEPPSRTKGRRASRLFSVLATKWWNELPLSVRTSESLAVFKKRFKTFITFLLNTSADLNLFT